MTSGILRATGSLAASASTNILLGVNASERRFVNEFRVGSNTTANVLTLNFENCQGWDGRSFTLGSEQSVNPSKFLTPLIVEGEGGSLSLQNTNAGTAVYELSVYYTTKT